MLAVNKIYTAHYSPLTERKSFLVKQFSNLGVTTEWFEEEPTGDDITSLYDSTKDSWDFKASLVPYENPVPFRQLNRAEISLAFKHVQMYERIVEEEIPTCLILEDDAVFSVDFVDQFNFNLFRTPKDWDFIFIGSGCNLRIDARQRMAGTVAYLKSHPASKCTDSYLVTYEAARKILDSIKPFSFPIDFELNYQMAHHDMQVYWWEPPIVTQGSQCGMYRSEIQL